MAALVQADYGLKALMARAGGDIDFGASCYALPRRDKADLSTSGWKNRLATPAKMNGVKPIRTP